MPISVTGGTGSLFIQRLIESNNKQLSLSLRKLAAGSRITRAADDVAGLQIANSLSSQVRGASQAQANVQDGINVLNTADGALDSVTENLQRVRELAVQAGSDTVGADQRSAINTEIRQLVNDIDRIAQGTRFNGTGLFSNVSSFKIQVGAGTNSATNTLDLATNSALGSFSASGLGLKTGSTLSIGVGSSGSALQTISKLDTALTTLGNRRASIGAVTNRLESASNNLAVLRENLAASESRIRDVDVAKESARLTQFQILRDAGATLLAQSYSQSSFALRLIGN